MSRPPSAAAAYDRGFGHTQGQNAGQGGYVRSPQNQATSAGYEQRGHEQRNSGAPTPYRGQAQSYFRGSAPSYGEARRYDDGGRTRGDEGGDQTRRPEGGVPGRRYGGRVRFAPYRYPGGDGYRAWRRGEVFPRTLLISDYILLDYAAYDLPPPQRADYEWVRYGPDAVLVDTYSGQIVDVDYGVFAAPPPAYADDGEGDYPRGYAGPPSNPPRGEDGYEAPSYPYGASPAYPRDSGYPPDGG